MIAAWFKKQREAAEAKAYAAGWDWASGKLLRGCGVVVVRSALDAEGDPTHPFDKGAYAALAEWEALCR